jgi:hypothetical protein
LSFFTQSAGSALKLDQKDVEVLVQITGPASMVQETVYGSRDQLATWKDGTPKMKALVPVRNEQGEEKTLHVPQSSALQKAIGAAIISAGATDLEVGGVLGLTWTGYGAGKNPANPPKSYAARYQPAAA